MIVIAGVFVFLFLVFIGCYIEKTNERIHSEKARQIYYSSKNLAKMEYDIAFYEKDSEGDKSEEQVTMDEVINTAQTHTQDFEMSIFNASEFEGNKEIVGKYNPDTDTDD